MTPITEKQMSLYSQIWRWHFYAGIFCIPFVVWLACTGSIYLFKPQIEKWIDRDYQDLHFHGSAATTEQMTIAALKSVPGSTLSAIQIPETTQSAVQILVKSDAQIFRAYVHPKTLEILKLIPEDKRFMRIIFQLHGELLMGDRGSMIVELAASWAIVLLITGLYLWWPRNKAGLAGVLYPRLKGPRRQFWRDIHAVTGFWISLFALFLLVSGLPWAKSWGGILKQVRQFSAPTKVKQDWPTSHSEHTGVHGDNTSRKNPDLAKDSTALNVLVAKAIELKLAAPVLLSPPTEETKTWTLRSDAQDRTKRTTVALDPTGNILNRTDFLQRPLLDQMIGVGIAAHEGHLFGLPNQLFNLLIAVGLITMSVSAAIMWLRRRPGGSLGAPTAVEEGALRIPRFLIPVIILIAVLLPLLGISLIVLLLCERLVLRRIPAVRNFLGLRAA